MDVICPRCNESHTNSSCELNKENAQLKEEVSIWRDSYNLEQLKSAKAKASLAAKDKEIEGLKLFVKERQKELLAENRHTMETLAKVLKATGYHL